MNDIVYNFGDYNEEIVDKINLILVNDYIPYYRKTGITFYYNSKRIFKLVKKQKRLEIEFNVQVSSQENVEVLTDESARNKKMGTCRWIYRGENLPVNLLKEVKDNFNEKFCNAK